MMKWLVWWLMPAAVLAQDYYLATFRNGARSPPRSMTLVLRDNASTNVTLAPGDGVGGGVAFDQIFGGVQHRGQRLAVARLRREGGLLPQ